MSSESNPNSTDDADVYPRASGVRVHTLSPDRRINSRHVDGRLRHLLGETYDGDRSLYDTLGYVKRPTFHHFKARYRRGGTATALVDKPAKDAWSEAPTVSDRGTDSDSDEDQTAFEQAVHDFLNGDFTRKKPTERFEAADRMARLGEYSLIFLGLSDENVVGGDLDALASPVDEASLSNSDDPGEGIEYLSVYTQEDAPVEGFDYVDDPSDPRFNQPKSYTVDFGKGRGTAEIHHSRVIHVVEDAVTDDLFSPSVLLRSLNRLDDIEKILGSSAEGFWRNAYQGLVVSPPEGAATGNTNLQQAASGLHDQIKRYRHNLEREIFTSGDVDTLSVNVEDPLPHLDAQYREISSGHDIPHSILQGNTTGERATEQDLTMYHEFLAQRERQHCEAQIFRAVIDRLIEYGVFPEPEHEENAYDVEWPPQEELTEQEEAEIAKTKAEAVNAAAGGQPDLLAPPEELRKYIFGWDPEYGGELEGMDIEPLEPLDEEDDAVQEQFDDLQAELDALTEGESGDAAADGGAVGGSPAGNADESEDETDGDE